MSEDPRKYAKERYEAVEKTMKGMPDVIKLCLVALYTEGHVLLEGNPGLGKTSLVNALAEELYFEFGRIQFTPDLMPTDITGAMMPNFRDPTQAWEFRKGPIFKELILADEINRASPKTQSAMLEAMAERKVTTLDKDKPRESLPKPFMVLATQNPIDQEGTYNLPEAQADRFMLKILMPVPGKQDMKDILVKVTGPKSEVSDHEPTLEQQRQAAEKRKKAAKLFNEFNSVIRATKIVGKVETHIQNLYLASNGKFDQIEEISAPAIPKLTALCELLQYGLGPRAPSALLSGVKGWVVLFGKESPLNEGVEKDAAEGFTKIVLPVLRHRIRPNFEWKENYKEFWKVNAKERGEFPEDLEDAKLREYFLIDLVLAAAPQTPEPRRSSQPYYDSIRTELQKQFPKLPKR